MNTGRLNNHCIKGLNLPNIISKKAENRNNYVRPVVPFLNARTAFKALLKELNIAPSQKILLPAYIGWSPNEGSGVFDPIKELEINYDFYRVNSDLSIDVEDINKKISSGNFSLVVLIHYFGYPDKKITEIASIARDNGVFILEDEAHAMYSDLLGGVCGRYGDAAILSLHKMLPVCSGGLLLLNKRDHGKMLERLSKCEYYAPLDYNLLEFDFIQIAKTRRNNAAILMELVAPLRGRVDLLFQSLPDGVVPQTLPILIRSASRDQIYNDLNNSGYGVVTLYHTLIKQITKEDFPVSHHLSQQILNLPVHQDISADQFEAMVIELSKLV
jgi:dTDP-4-amino-4,6-dideoxygalactose transaminase